VKPRKSVVTGRRRTEPYERPRRRPALGAAPLARPQPRTPSTSQIPTPRTFQERETQASIDLLAARPGALVLASPVLLASGAAGYGLEFGTAGPPFGSGGLITPTTTLRPRPGARGPRMVEVPEGIVLAVGFQNPGIEAVLERYAPAWVRWRLPVIVSLGADSAAGFATLATRLDGVPGIAGIELNLAWPDPEHRGQPFDVDARAAGAVTARVRSSTDLPLIVKLAGSAPNVREVGRAVEAEGADAIAAINAVPARAVVPGGRLEPPMTLVGGLSGPAIHPLALHVVADLVSAVRLPIIACGGVASLADVQDFLAVGATAVGLATAALADPSIAGRLADELAAIERGGSAPTGG
jgi:dihydroorotate dehydrogenase (NAD+) catalytic subunit